MAKQINLTCVELFRIYMRMCVSCSWLDSLTKIILLFLFLLILSRIHRFFVGVLFCPGISFVSRISHYSTNSWIDYLGECMFIEDAGCDKLPIK